MLNTVADGVAPRVFLLLFFIGLAVFAGAACQGIGEPSAAANPENGGSDSQSIPSATDDGQQSATLPLRFVPTATPDTRWAEVKATVAAADLRGLGGMAVDDSFYALIAECGGPILIRDSIIETMVPSDLLVDRGGWYVQSEGLLYPVKLQLIQGWTHAVEWSVLVRSRSDVWKVTASGKITDDCEVVTDRSTRPMP